MSILALDHSVLHLRLGPITTTFLLDFDKQEYYKVPVQRKGVIETVEGIFGHDMHSISEALNIDDLQYCESLIVLSDADKARFTGLDKPVATIKFGEKLINLHPGVIATLGGTNTGKTYLTKNIIHAQLDQRFGPDAHERVVFSEPEYPALVSLAQLQQRIAWAIVSRKKVLSIDSFRYLIFSGTGSTGKGGMDMGIFNTLTSLSLIGSAVGLAINIIINPLTADEDLINNYTTALEGSAHSVLNCTTRGRASYISRGENDRITESLTVPGPEKKRSGRSRDDESFDVKVKDHKERVPSLVRPPR